MALTTSTTIPREGGRNGKDSRHAPCQRCSATSGHSKAHWACPGWR
jgi:hypothetical protein